MSNVSNSVRLHIVHNPDLGYYSEKNVLIRAHFYVSLVFVAMCSAFWLFWLSYQYLPSDWPERLL